jgi:hypothetical protein
MEILSYFFLFDYWAQKTRPLKGREGEKSNARPALSKCHSTGKLREGFSLSSAPRGIVSKPG